MDTRWGIENSPIFNAFKRSVEEDGADRAQETLRREARVADAAATAYLAAMNCPEDIRLFGQHIGVPNFSEMTWEQGFTRGWRMAVAHERKEPDMRQVETIRDPVARAELAAAVALGKSLARLLSAVEEMVNAAPELNMGNYDMDQVETLNNSMIEIHIAIVRDRVLEAARAIGWLGGE